MAYLENQGRQAADDICVLSYDCDKYQKLKLSSALRYFQEISDMHCRFFGYGHDELIKSDMIFLLVNSSVNIIKTPKFRDKLKVVSWHRGMSTGVQFTRDNIMIDQNGKTVVECATRWILANPKTHKIIRRGNEFTQKIPQKEGEYLENTRLGKIVMPSGLDYAGERKIYHSDIDYNGHLNNSNYADFMMDFMPVSLDGKRLANFDIYYCSEAVEGDKLKIYSKILDEKIYFRGEHQRGKCFEGVCCLKDEVF